MKIFTLLILILIVFVSGCTYPSNTPSETVNSFVDAYNFGNYSTCYSLMCSDYKDTYTIDAFNNAIENVGSEWNKYKFIGIVDGSENIQDDAAFIEFEYEVYSEFDDSSFGLTKLGRSALNLESVFTKRIELVNETTGWKLKAFHKEMIDID